MPVGATRIGRADLSKTETHTEAPMAQLGRAAASGSIMVMFGLFRFRLLASTGIFVMEANSDKLL